MKRLSWKEMTSRLRVDRERLRAFVLEREPGMPPPGRLHPSYVCVFLYRVSNYLFRGGHRQLARCVWHINLLVTGADISPAADLGEGLLIHCPAGTAIMGTAGKNLTVMACAGMGGETGRVEDIGAGPGLGLVGDDVVLEPHCGVLGPVRVGNRVRVGAGIGLTQHVEDDTYVEGAQARTLRRRDL